MTWKLTHKVKFTYELKYSKQLALLDVDLDNSMECMKLSVHRKTTHTGLYNKQKSLALLKYKTSFKICYIGPTEFAVTADF